MVDALTTTRKPPPARQIGIERTEPLASGLRTLLLFDDHRLTDLAQLSRAITRQGAVTLERGSHGGQARSNITGTTGAAFQPCLRLTTLDAATSSLTISALVRFPGTALPTSSYGAIGAALAANSTGQVPLFISGTAGTFRTRVPAETAFLSGGSPLSVSSLSGWHRLTVTISGTTATLYVDGGRTFIGTASQAFANFVLRSVLGSDVTAGYEWPLPTADFFYWARALSADEVRWHADHPYAVVSQGLTDERWIATAAPSTPVSVGSPFSSDFTDEFGPVVNYGVVWQQPGRGQIRASAVVLHGAQALSSQMNAGGFLHVGAGVTTPSATTISVGGALRADATQLRPGIKFVDAGLFGTVGLTAAARLSLTPRARLGGQGTLNAAPVGKWYGLTWMRGTGALRADAQQVLPLNRMKATIDGVGSLRADGIVTHAPPRQITFAGQGTLTVTSMRATYSLKPKLNAYGRLTAKARIRKMPRVRPGIGVGVEPQIVAVEIDTYVPGNVPIIATMAHGTRAHGTLSRTPPTQLENTAMIRASDVGFRTAPTDIGGPTSYPPLVSDAYQIDVALNLEPGRTTAAAAWGSVLLANPKRQFDGLIGVQNSDGRDVRLYAGSKVWDDDRQYFTDPAFSRFSTLFRGLATPWSLTDDGLSVPLRDATYFLEKPLQADVYGGSGQLDGTADLAGKPKPMARGGYTNAPIQNITPVLIDPVNRIYQYNDGPGQVAVLYEGAASAIGNPIPGGITFQADTTNLYAGTTNAGQYRTDNSRGLFQLGSPPVGQITVDVYGYFQNAGWVINPFEICRFLIAEDMQIPASLIDAQSFVNLHSTHNYTAGVYFSSDEHWTCIQAIDSILTSLGANLVPTRAGTLKLILLRAISSSEPVTQTFDESQILTLTRRPMPAALDPPSYRWRVGYSHNYTVMTGNAINTSLATNVRQQFVVSPDRYATQISTSLLNAYRRPNDYQPMPGPLLVQANAQEVANDLVALWSTPRRLYDVTLPRRFFGPEIGDVVHIRYPIEQLVNGRDGRIVGYSLRAADGTIVYTVLV